MMEISNIGLLTALLAGTVSFLSPCVLPLVPGYLSYITGRSFGDHAVASGPALRLPAVGRSLCFVLGFSTVFVLLGASATALGQILLAHRYELTIAGGLVVILFGLLLTGFPRLSWFQRTVHINTSVRGGQPVGAYLLGLAFGFGWTPCIGPVLGAILTLSATQVGVRGGVALLAVYALGLGLPFVVSAAFTGGFVARLRTMRKLGRILQPATGAVMILMGVAMVTGRLSEFSYWLLDAFPGLVSIG